LDSLAPNSQWNELSGWLGWLTWWAGWFVGWLTSGLGLGYLGRTMVEAMIMKTFATPEVSSIIGFHKFLDLEGRVGAKPRD